MKTLEITSTDIDTHSIGEEELPSNTSTSVELTEAREKRLSNAREATEGHTVSLESRKDEAASKNKISVMVFNVISSIVLIVIGIVVLKVTGLYDGMDSTAGKITLCVVTSYCYLIAFRRGYNQNQ